jgi:LmbE family N-acetylglucosaminyl deacetylase
MAPPTLLAVFAHPDDESYVCGGTLAQWAARGGRVVLACATRGEAGEIAEAALARRDDLAAVREGELRAAAAHLDIGEVHLLNYADGTLGQVAFPEGVERLGPVVAAAQATIVLTFGPEGVYGHADHVAVHRWTKEAFHLARQAGSEARLYYCAPPRSWYRAVSERCRARGVPDRYGPRLDVLGVPDELVTTRLDVAAEAPARLAAIRAHRTQLPADHPFATLPDADLHELLAVECFTRAWPPLPRHSPVENGLLTECVP